MVPGASSSLAEIKAGVPQGSILGPLLFLVYINDIVNDIQAHLNLFADNTSLFVVVDCPNYNHCFRARYRQNCKMGRYMVGKIQSIEVRITCYIAQEGQTLSYSYQYVRYSNARSE